MKSWIAIPALGLGVAAILAFSTPVGANHGLMASGACSKSTSFVLTAPRKDACVFAADAGGASQCKASAVVLATPAEDEQMIWPGGIIDLTVSAAFGAYQATIDFVGSLYNYAEETSDNLI